MKVLVTGSAGCLAKALLPKLCQHEAISSVVGIDTRPSTVEHSKFQSHIMDIRSPDLAALFSGINVVIHLAFIVQSGDLKSNRNNQSLIRDININGSINVFQTAQQCAVKHIVYLSSAVVYGGSLNNAVVYEEAHTMKIIKGLNYSEHKVEIEQWLDQFQNTNVYPTITRLRPHMILGKHSQPLLTKLFDSVWLPKTTNQEPLIQAVWEDDVVIAIISSLLKPTNDSYNLCTDDHASMKQLLTRRHGKINSLPYALVQRCHQLCWQFTGRFGDPSWLNIFNRHFCLSNNKIRQKLGWQPSLTLTECVSRLND